MIVLVLLTRAERDALRAVAVDQAQPPPRPSAALARGIQALDDAVRWDRAGRVFFGLTPGAARAILGVLERTRPMWDDGRRSDRHVHWFARRLRASL